MRAPLRTVPTCRGLPLSALTSIPVRAPLNYTPRRGLPGSVQTSNGRLLATTLPSPAGSNSILKRTSPGPSIGISRPFVPARRRYPRLWQGRPQVQRSHQHVWVVWTGLVALRLFDPTQPLRDDWLGPGIRHLVRTCSSVSAWTGTKTRHLPQPSLLAVICRGYAGFR